MFIILILVMVYHMYLEVYPIYQLQSFNFSFNFNIFLDLFNHTVKPLEMYFIKTMYTVSISSIKGWQFFLVFTY